MTERRIGVGIIGAGVISEIYLKNLTTVMPHTRVVGVADLIAERAQQRAAQFGVQVLTIDELLQHPDIDLVVNLTIPRAHASVATQVVEAGKSVYNEKPLTIELQDASRILEIAQARGVLVGCAPDTFLGGGLQTARELIDSGVIGRPVAATASMITRGHESWHPDPDFYYQPGAGPMLDMGPYYVTALVALLGSVQSVTGMTGKSFTQRTITSQPRFGEKIPVNVDTHLACVLQFESGVIAQLQTTFDLFDTEHARLVVYGSEGTLRLPDPNTFGGPIQILKPASSSTENPGEVLAGAKPEWRDVPLTHPYTENSRGLGVSDLARALLEGGTPRASGELALHVLEVMNACLSSGIAGTHQRLTTSIAERPAPL